MVLSIVSQILVCSLAAYVFARLRFKGKEVLFLLFLGMMIVPGQIFMVPHYDIMFSLNLNNTLTAIWLPKTFNIFGLFLLRQAFQTLPRNLDEAAKIDGAWHFRIYWNVLMPLMKAPIISLCIMTGLGAWKDLMWPLIINTDMEKMVLSAGLPQLVYGNLVIALAKKKRPERVYGYAMFHMKDVREKPNAEEMLKQAQYYHDIGFDGIFFYLMGIIWSLQKNF